MGKEYSTLRTLREKNSLTYLDMAMILGISKSYYFQLEKKQRRLHYEMAKKIAKVFNLKPDDIFYKDN